MVDLSGDKDPFATRAAQRDADDPFAAELERRESGFRPLRAAGRFLGDVASGVVGAVRGQQDPAFADVGGFTGEGIRDPEALSAIQRAKVLGIDDKAFGRLVKEALGVRLIRTEKDKFGQEVITFRDDAGKIRREFINKPGLEGQDIDRLISSSVPFLAAGGAVGAGARAVGAGLPLLTAGQTLGQAATSIGVDVAADEPISAERAIIAGGGGAAGELLAPAIRGLRELFRRSPGLIDRTTGQVTQEGLEAIQQAGIDPRQITPEFLDNLTSPDIRRGQGFEAALRAQTGEFGIPSSVGQRTREPGALSLEEEARRGLIGRQAQEVASAFDVQQRETTRRAIGDIGEGFGGAVPETPAAAGQAFQRGLAREEERGTRAITQAFQNVDIGGVFPRGIPKQLFDDLGARINENLGTQQLSTRRTPTALAAAKFLDDFSQGRVRQPTVRLLRQGARGKPPQISFDTVRRDINNFVGDAVEPADVRATVAIKRSYNDWIENLANSALQSANPSEFAKLQSAIGLTRSVKSLFEQQGKTDDAGRLIRTILDRADSPEGAINVLFPTNFRSAPKRGSVAATERLKTILQKEQPDAWHALRQAYWLRISRGPQGAIFRDTPVTRRELDTAFGQVERNINDAFKNQQSLVGVLFSPGERNRMKSFAKAMRRAQAENLNPSGTAFESKRIQQFARDNVLTNLLRRQAAGQQIRGNAVRATFWRVMTRRATNIFGSRGETLAARRIGRQFSERLQPLPRQPGFGGVGGAAAVQLENQGQE